LGWLNPDFVSRLNLQDRWNNIFSENEVNTSVRPEAYSYTSSRYWTLNFEGFDPGILGVRVESCHPFFDLRVLNFMLALPALPWCSDKELLRSAVKGILPDEVRLRRKSPLLQDPIIALLQKPEAAWVDNFTPLPELRQYVQLDRIPKVYRCHDSVQAWTGLKPLSLNFWLQRRNMLPTAIAAESIEPQCALVLS
jgi:asparagine synthase (glutamine-hydrolysing)